MNASHLKLSLYAIVTALSVHTLQVNAQEESSSSQQPGSSQPQSTHETASQMSSGVLLSKLMDFDFKSNDGEDLGKLEELLINPRTGKIGFAVLARGGFLGIGEKLVPVPWQAIQLKSEDEFTVNADKDKLQSAPTVDKTYSNIQTPSYAMSVYRHFGLRPEMGGAESPGGTGQSQSQSDKWKQDTHSDSESHKHDKDHDHHQ